MRSWWLVILICINGLISAKSEAAEKSAQPVLAVIDFYPFGYSLNGAPPEGLAFDINVILEKYSGIKIDARLMSVPRALRSASIGQHDMLFSYKDPIMVPNVIFLGNTGCLTPLIVPHKNSNIKTLEDLHGKRVGFVSLGYFAVKKKTQWRIIPVELGDNFIMVKMLIRGRLDAIVVNDTVLNSFVLHPELVEVESPDWLKQLGQPLALDHYETHFSISEKSPFIDLIPQLQQGMKVGYETGEFKQAYEKYGGADSGLCYTAEELATHQWLK